MNTKHDPKAIIDPARHYTLASLEYVTGDIEKLFKYIPTAECIITPSEIIWRTDFLAWLDSERDNRQPNNLTLSTFPSTQKSETPKQSLPAQTETMADTPTVITQCP